MLTKICSKCERELPATNKYFYKEAKGKYGLRAACKTCRDAEHRKYYEVHKEDLRAYGRNYGETYCPQHKEQKKAYTEAHREQIKTYNKTHKAQIKIYYRTYYEKHEQEEKDRWLKYNETHREQRRIYTKNWRIANPGRVKERNMQKRALTKAATIVDFSLVDWFSSQPQPFRCYLCGKLIRKNQKYHIEHRIPLSRDGLHAPWNLGIAHDKCNLSKHTKTPWEYKPDRFQPELFL